MRKPLQRKRLSIATSPQENHSPSLVQDFILEGYEPGQIYEDLRRFQNELEIQNKALRYSQQEAEAASERFATLFSNVPLALMVVDESGMVLASNTMALKLLQPLESDMPLNFLKPFISEENIEAVGMAFSRARQDGSSLLGEIVFKVASKGSFKGDMHIARIENPQDELAHFICAVIDQSQLLAQRQALLDATTVLRQRNEDLLRSENRNAAIINSSLDAIFCVDKNQKITVFNPAATALFQCRKEDALGRDVKEFLPYLGDALLLSETHSTQTVLSEMEACTFRGAKIIVELSISREDEQTSSDVVSTLFARDLTARKKSEAHRAALESQLRVSQKMQAVGTMAGGIAHDFNNILGAILGNVKLAKQDCVQGSAVYPSLEEIEKAGRRARDLVREILTFSRNETPKRSVIRLGDVLRETAHLIKVTLPPVIELEIHESMNLPAILADSIQVEQAILNLCTNAVLAIGQHRGKVYVDLATFKMEKSQAQALDLPPGQYATLSVTDSGNGIEPQLLERIFEPFFTTREVGQGTGLGLSVVHGIMKSHGGAVDVHSVVGVGSVFTLYFPTTDIQPEPFHAEAPSEKPLVQGNNQHVMYVDDDQALVFLVKRVLTRKNYKVSTFTDPRVALEAMKANARSYDLLVTDYNMPGFSGLDLLRACKLLRADLPIVLASGYITPEMEERALKEGANGLIHKPNDVDELCETVHRLLTQKKN